MAQMKTLDTTDLSTVCGGVTSKNDAITQQLMTLTQSIKDQANKPQDNTMMLLMVMMMGKGGSTVVAGGAPPPPPAYAAAPPPPAGPVINISTRIRRW